MHIHVYKTPSFSMIASLMAMLKQPMQRTMTAEAVKQFTTYVGVSMLRYINHSINTAYSYYIITCFCNRHEELVQQLEPHGITRDQLASLDDWQILQLLRKHKVNIGFVTHEETLMLCFFYFNML